MSDIDHDDDVIIETLLLPLDGWHRTRGGRMVEFAGYWMPVQYEGIMAEHLWVRESAGLFDVSHMGQIVLTSDADGEGGGADAVAKARARAELYARAAGLRVDRIVSISEAGQDDGGPSNPRPMFRMAAAEARAPTQILPGDTEITATVNVRFLLK